MLFEKLMPGARHPSPLLSPSGESIITFRCSKIQLSHTKRFAATTSNVLVQIVQHTGQEFVLEFLPDRPLAVATRKKDKVVTVLDLKSGVPQLTIDAPMDVYGVGPIKNTFVVLGYEKAIIWNLPGGNLLPGASQEQHSDSEIRQHG